MRGSCGFVFFAKDIIWRCGRGGLRRFLLFWDVLVGNPPVCGVWRGFWLGWGASLLAWLGRGGGCGWRALGLYFVGRGGTLGAGLGIFRSEERRVGKEC